MAAVGVQALAEVGLMATALQAMAVPVVATAAEVARRRVCRQYMRQDTRQGGQKWPRTSRCPSLRIRRNIQPSRRTSTLQW